jgi:putative aldouronate transport system substrate-binding protein
MKKTKKGIAMLLIVAMFSMMVIGCSSTKATPSSEGGVSVSDTDTDTQSEEVPTYKLAVHTNAAQGDWNEYWLIKNIEEKFGVNIEVEMISSDIWEDKLSLMFASDELPDFFINSVSDADITTYGSQEYFLKLDDYLTEEYTPNIVAAMKELPALKAALTSTDGHIYSIKGADMLKRELSQARFYINTEWADQILGKQPETLDEFYQYLVGVKEKDMNGNGDSTDEIPLGGYYDAPFMINVSVPILAALGYTQTTVEAIDGKVVYVPAEETYKEYLTFMNKLYSEGLLDPEYFSQTADQVNAKETNYRYGAYSYYACWVNQSDKNIWSQYDGLDPMTSNYNTKQLWPARDINTAGNFIITKNVEDPKKLLEIVDWMFTREGIQELLFGYEKGTVEGMEDYGYSATWNDDVLSVDKYYPEDKYADYNSFMLAEMCPDYGYFPFYRNFSSNEAEEQQKYLTENIENHYADYYHVGWPTSIKFTTEETNELSLLETDIATYKAEMETKMIIGDTSIDDFDKFVEGLEKRQLSRYIEIYQNAYDRWLALQ